MVRVPLQRGFQMPLRRRRITLGGRTSQSEMDLRVGRIQAECSFKLFLCQPVIMLAQRQLPRGEIRIGVARLPPLHPTKDALQNLLRIRSSLQIISSQHDATGRIAVAPTIACGHRVDFGQHRLSTCKLTDVPTDAGPQPTQPNTRAELLERLIQGHQRCLVISLCQLCLQLQRPPCFAELPSLDRLSCYLRTFGVSASLVQRHRVGQIRSQADAGECDEPTNQRHTQRQVLTTPERKTPRQQATSTGIPVAPSLHVTTPQLGFESIFIQGNTFLCWLFSGLR